LKHCQAALRKGLGSIESQANMDSAEEHVEGSLRRPVSVTVISFLLIIYALIPLITVFVIAFFVGLDSNLLRHSLALIIGCVVPVLILALAIVCVIPIIIVFIGVGMLKGRNWALQMFLWLTPIYIAFAITAQVSQGSITLGPFINVIFYVIFVLFLTRPASFSYFAQYSQSKLIFFLWFRYLRKKRIVLLSIAAVALVVTLLTTVSSLFTGFITVFEQSAVKAMGDIVLEPPMRFSKYPQLIERLEQIGSVEAATGVLSAQGLLHLGKGNVRAVSVRGIEPGRQAKVTGFQQSLIKQGKSSGEPSFEFGGEAETAGMFVGIGVLAEPDEQTDKYDFAAIEEMIGDEVVLTTGTASGDQVRRKIIKAGIADIVFTGVYELDKSFVYLSIEELQKKLYPEEDGQIANQVQIKLAVGAETDSALAQIRGVWGDFADKQLNWSPYLINQTTIITAKEMQSRYVAELRKQMRILLFIFGVVDCSVVLLIICIFYMIVRLKQKDIAIIKSYGASSGSVCFIFVAFGFCVGVIGSIFGALLGYVVTKNINAIEECIRKIFGLKLWKSSVYMFSQIPNEVNWSWASTIVLTAILAAIAGTLIPAIVAARTKPVDILRYE